MDSRRRAVLSALGVSALGLVPALRAEEPVFRMGLTAVFLDDEVRFLRRWCTYLEQRLERKVAFVQRGRYSETIELLRQRQLDAAWICGFPYVRFRTDLQLVAVPLFEGKPLYRSYLIVPQIDTVTKSIFDLRGTIFAFSDPDSNSGYLYPTYQLHEAGERPDTFFRRAFFTWAHRDVVTAVSTRLARGGSVDGYVWETMRRAGGIASSTRVVSKSPEFGHPPIVARASLPSATADRLRRVLTGMIGDAEGRDLLAILNLDGFTPGNDQLFDSIATMWHAVQPV